MLGLGKMCARAHICVRVCVCGMFRDISLDQQNFLDKGQPDPGITAAENLKIEIKLGSFYQEVRITLIMKQEQGGSARLYCTAFPLDKRL